MTVEMAYDKLDPGCGCGIYHMRGLFNDCFRKRLLFMDEMIE